VNGIHEVRGSIPLSSTNQINQVGKTGKRQHRRLVHFLSIPAERNLERREAAGRLLGH
jgi:hypothetical protein